jgi:hypothetical protein
MRALARRADVPSAFFLCALDRFRVAPELIDAVEIRFHLRAAFVVPLRRADFACGQATDSSCSGIDYAKYTVASTDRFTTADCTCGPTGPGRAAAFAYEGISISSL